MPFLTIAACPVSAPAGKPLGIATSIRNEVALGIKIG